MNSSYPRICENICMIWMNKEESDFLASIYTVLYKKYFLQLLASTNQNIQTIVKLSRNYFLWLISKEMAQKSIFEQ